MDWFLYDGDLRYETVKTSRSVILSSKTTKVRRPLIWVLDNSNFLFFYHMLLFRFRHNGSTTISWQNTDNWRMTH